MKRSSSSRGCEHQGCRYLLPGMGNTGLPARSTPRTRTQRCSRRGPRHQLSPAVSSDEATVLHGGESDPVALSRRALCPDHTRGPHGPVQHQQVPAVSRLKEHPVFVVHVVECYATNGFLRSAASSSRTSVASCTRAARRYVSAPP